MAQSLPDSMGLYNL
uniref:Truncated p6 n=1 Tax=Sweet potato chlorotic stunt virus TaxID=81931 RepID=A0A193KWP5_9CLOS|nr:truncated p6 [Sweet potato chlorotic stunt virus]